MRRIINARPTPVVIAAVLAALIAGTGTAVAARLITGKQIKNGTIQAKDLSASVRSALNDRGARGPQGTVGPQGAQGAQGPAGASGQPGLKGDPGAPATRLWAVVRSPNPGNPFVVRGSGAVGVTDRTDGNGTLRVRFNRDISGCTYVASVGGTDGDGGGDPFDQGFISTEFDRSDRTAVSVATRNTAGTPADLSFHLIVVC